MPFVFWHVAKCKITPSRRVQLIGTVDAIQVNDPCFLEVKEWMARAAVDTDMDVLENYKNHLKDALEVYEKEVSSPSREVITLHMPGMPFPVLVNWTKNGGPAPKSRYYYFFGLLNDCTPVQKLLHDLAREDHAKTATS
jgi:hypothetical protein